MRLSILLTSAIAFSARFLPFLLAERLNRLPWMRTLARRLPPAIMVLLVAYSLAGRPFLAYPYGIPEVIGIGITLAVHLWRSSMLLSILAGVTVYQTLIHTLFTRG